MELFKNVKRLLYVWGVDQAANLEKTIIEIKKFSEAEVIVENADRLALATYRHSTFDSAILASSEYSTELLANILKFLTPGGRICIHKFAGDINELFSDLRLSGFVNVEQKDENILAYKPNYEIGSTVKLSFAKAVDEKAKIKAIWELDNDDDLINPDDLLEEEDKAIPDPSTLKVCGTTGKRKACKNCSCGLAEELSLEQNNKVNTSNAKSSCGNCYLGDAFRCSSCPYMGLPAFQPGEKVQLPANFLKADI